MATITAVVTKLSGSPDTGYHVIWEALDDGDPGSAIELVPYSDRSVQFVGTFSTTTVILEGSNDGATWTGLENANGDAITTTSSGALFSIGPITRFVRPHITSVGSNPDVDVHMVITGPKKS